MLCHMMIDLGTLLCTRSDGKDETCTEVITISL